MEWAGAVQRPGRADHHAGSDSPAASSSAGGSGADRPRSNRPARGCRTTCDRTPRRSSRARCSRGAGTERRRPRIPACRAAAAPSWTCSPRLGCRETPGPSRSWEPSARYRRPCGRPARRRPGRTAPADAHPPDKRRRRGRARSRLLAAQRDLPLSARRFGARPGSPWASNADFQR